MKVWSLETWWRKSQFKRINFQNSPETYQITTSKKFSTKEISLLWHRTLEGLGSGTDRT